MITKDKIKEILYDNESSTAYDYWVDFDTAATQIVELIEKDITLIVPKPQES